MASGFQVKTAHVDEVSHYRTNVTRSLELLQLLRDRISREKRSEDGLRRRLLKQLSVLSDILHSVHENEEFSEECTFYTKGVLDEYQRVIESLSVKNVLFANNECLKKMELELIQVNGSLVAALALALSDMNKEIHLANQTNRLIGQNPDGNFHAMFPRPLNVPNEVEDLTVSYDKGNVRISWTKLGLTDIIDFFQMMRDDDPSNLFPNISAYCDHVDLFYDPIRNFKPFKKYTVRIRAVNGAGKSNWSEAAIVCIKEAPPNKPPCPPKLVTFFCSSTGSTSGDVDSVRLSVPYPKESDCNGLHLEKIIVEYSNGHAKEPSYYQAYKFFPENGQEILDIRNINFKDSPTYTFATTWSNSAGHSPTSSYLEVSKRDAVPSPPTILTETSKAVGNSVKICWIPPVMNTFAVEKYVVEMKSKRKNDFMTAAESVDSSITIEGLKQRKSYFFRVHAVTASGKSSQYSQVIKLKTELSENMQEALRGVAFGGLACGAVAGPFVGPVVGPAVGIGAAVGLGIRASKKADSKVGKVAVGTTVAMASALPMAVLGTVVTPVLIPVCAGAAARKLVLAKKERVHV